MFNKVTIFGTGLIGASFGAAYKRSYPDALITGVTDEDDKVRLLKCDIFEKIMHESDIDDVVRASDLVIIATPIKVIIYLIEKFFPLIKPGALVCDMGSTKVDIMKAADRFRQNDVHFIGGHPLAGSERTGMGAASADLLAEKRFALIPDEQCPEEVVVKLSSIIAGFGALPFITDAETHDSVVAATSHLPQLVSLALMNSVGKKGSEIFDFTGPGLKDMTRLAGSSFSIWQDIIETNRQNISKTLSGYINELNQLQQILENSDLSEIFNLANRFHADLSTKKETK